MLDGVDGLVTHRTKAALKATGQTVLTVKLANLHIIMIDLIDDAMLEAHFLQNSTRNRPPFTNNRLATPCSPTPVVAQVQVAPQAPKGYTLQQLKWLDPAKRLPLGDTGKAACAFLGSINACFSCCQTGHHRLLCLTRPPSSPSQHSSSAPAANLISLADDDSPDAPGIFLVDPIADQLVQDGATALAGSVPLLMVTCRIQANDGPATALVDSGAGINIIDQEYAAQLGLRGTPVPPVGTKMADNRAGPVIEQEYLVDVSIGETIYAAMPFYAMPLAILRDFTDILPANISDVSHYPPICSSMSQVCHHINILPNTAPVAKAGFRVPLAWRETLRQDDWGIVDVGDQSCGSQNNSSLGEIHHECTDQLVNDNKGAGHPDRLSEIWVHPLVREKGAWNKQHGKGRQFHDRGDSGGCHEDGCDEESQHCQIFAKHWEKPLEVRDGIRYETPDTPSVKAWP
ncbi:hypothetical protein C359_01789 [Cryptococcus neoformans Bt120]|nr:hypothetical protein C359_01789 [Cryptococcus neoformans var. grubii Bt120]